MPGNDVRIDSRAHRQAFTLVEMLVSIAVLTLFLLLLSQLLNSAATITAQGNKRMDADSQGRLVLDRMAVDFGQMMKRSDVDYYLKGGTGGSQTGNDQIAFYSHVRGYYPAAGSQSPVSLVAYRVNSLSGASAFNKLERLGKGLLWNGASPSSTPVVFSPQTISVTWPAATTSNGIDSDYETLGPDVFRFEYYYLLIGQTVGGTTYTSKLSYTPWDTRITGHNAVAGFRDVSAIAVTIAVLDPKSRMLVSDSQLGTLKGQMLDFSPTMQPGDLDAQWQSALNTTTAAPRAAASAIHIYTRFFPIAP
jgi:prepilin-type N-terminal cleavage/methylation domain-containing protein